MSFNEEYIIKAEDVVSVYDEMSNTPSWQRYDLKDEEIAILKSYFYAGDRGVAPIFYAKGLKEQIQNYLITDVRYSYSQWGPGYNMHEQIDVKIDGEWREFIPDA